MTLRAQPDPLVVAQHEATAQLAIANEWYGKLEAFVITTDQEQEHIVGVLQEVKARYKAIEDKRTSFTKPLNDVIKGLNDFFRPPKTKFETLERLLKDKITTYLQAKQAANVAALQAAAAAPTPIVAQQALAHVRPVEAPQSVSVRYVWQFQIVQPELVPAQFLSPDVAKIQAYLAQTNEPAIPGVVFSQKPITTVRQGR